MESRLCVYSQLDDNGSEWRLPADKPVYKHMYSLVMESITATSEEEDGMAAKLGVKNPWTSLLRAPSNGERAGSAAAPSAMGRRLAARCCKFGDYGEAEVAGCELCKAPYADVLHRISGECAAIPQAVRDLHAAGARSALKALAD